MAGSGELEARSMCLRSVYRETADVIYGNYGTVRSTCNGELE